MGTYNIAMKNALGERIRTRMKQRGVTQEQLADAVGIGQSQVSRILAGERGTDIEVIKRIADFLMESQREYIMLFAGIPVNQKSARLLRIEEKLNRIENDKDMDTVEGVIDLLTPEKKAQHRRRINNGSAS